MSSLSSSFKMPSFRALGRDRKAVTALEYGLIAAVVVVAGLAGFSGIGDQLFTTFGNVNTAIQNDAGPDSTGG